MRAILSVLYRIGLVLAGVLAGAVLSLAVSHVVP